MLETTPIQKQLAGVQDDPLRVLIVGAGVAGVTLAQLLRRRGLHPVLLERAGRDAGSGYMLALMPLVDPVLVALDVRQEYDASSIGLRRYQIHDRNGAPIREYAMDQLLNRFGDYRGISRGELLRVLGSHGGTVTYGAAVTGIEQRPDAVRTTIDDGAMPVDGDFDLVVAADGLHSTTRDLVLDSGNVATYDTGWGGWVTWTDLDEADDLGQELWGAGLFIGTYPVKDRLGILVGGPRADTRVGPERFVARARRALGSLDPRLDRVLEEVARGDDAYYWSLTDCRAATWSAGRVVLLGDAAAGFLPTAGIGACMAMESAWMLAGHLDSISPDQVAGAMRDYERAQRPRVEAAQDNSRQLARLLFRRSKPLAAVRDVATRFIPLETVLGPIRKLLQNQPQTASPQPTQR